MIDHVKIGKRERKALAPALLYGWKIYTRGRGAWRWDDDATMPFLAVESLQSLVRKGLMEWCFDEYRATALARTLRCKYCHQGKLYQDDEEIGACKRCDGTGVVLEITDQPPAKTPDPDSDTARLARHRDLFRTVHPDVATANRTALGNAQEQLQVAIGHLQAMLNTARNFQDQQSADTAARNWLISIGSDPA